MTDNLRQAIKDYVESGGKDAIAFSLTHAPRFGVVPGKEVQRLIDEELNEKETV